MAQNYYVSFKKKLEEIFMMDHAELDFGIYRIMNQKRNDIQRFLDLELLPQVKQVLEGNNGGEADKAKKRMAEITASVGGNIEVLPKGTPMRDEYDKLKAQLAQSADTESMQAEVFSHLVTFFSRYYDGGDFLSKRRYKDNTYAIPYNGEEVKLHWANSDQYYIKTSEYFRNYTFVLPTSRKKVHFVLKDASTEQNNNRAANNMERRFALYVPENDEPIVETTAEGELNIYFTYELMPKATKQKDLLSAALEAGTFDYYHLISGQDLPLKGQDYIHTFFEQNAGKNFILFDANAEKNHLVEERFQQYHFLQNSIGRNSGLWIAFLERVERLSISIQKSLKVNRISKYPHKVYKGGNWFSITHEMASYVVSRKNDIKKWFNYSLCADELFLQTVAMESPLRETIIDDSLREIDWERGKPYTYRSDDYELLMSSHNLFARKFSSDIDKNIIEMVYENAVSK